jgi:rhamnulose-1-phosphate aldolase
VISEPYPGLDNLLATIGEAGTRICEIEASEGAAGNISVCVRWPVEVRTAFPVAEPITLPQPVPELAGATLIVSGSGRRLRELADNPAANVGVVAIDASGTTGTLHTAPGRLFANLTSEFNSHLAVHADQVALTGTNYHAVIHAQPMRLTYLSHLTAYTETVALNRRLLRWQPELIVQLPEGIGYLPFEIPGSRELMEGSLKALREHRIVVWAKHGVLARSDRSVKNAADRVEYAETAARYEYLDLAAGGHGAGLSDDEILRVCHAFDIKQTIFPAAG